MPVPDSEWEAAGTHFDRHVTWWPQSGARLTYPGPLPVLAPAGPAGRGRLLLLRPGRAGPCAVSRADETRPMPSGYDYDVCNTEVLCSRMAVRGGRVVLPDGVGYQVLVLPEGATR